MCMLVCLYSMYICTVCRVIFYTFDMYYDAESCIFLMLVSNSPRPTSLVAGMLVQEYFTAVPAISSLADFFSGMRCRIM